MMVMNKNKKGIHKNGSKKINNTINNLDLDSESFNIDELETDTFGRLIVPNTEGSVFVYDENIGYKILFQ